MPNIFRAKAAVLRNRRLESVSSDCAMGIQASCNPPTDRLYSASSFHKTTKVREGSGAANVSLAASV